jgi:hypothetical protein
MEMVDLELMREKHTYGVLDSTSDNIGFIELSECGQSLSFPTGYSHGYH